MGRIGGGELLLLLIVALLVFGPSKLADLGKGLGEGLKNFKRGISDDDKHAKPDGTPAVAPSPPELPRVDATDPSGPGKPPSAVN